VSFTAQVRDELAHADAGEPCCRRAELSALLRLGGSLHVRQGRPVWVTTVSSNAVARRLHAGLTQLAGSRPTVEVHHRTALRGTAYQLQLAAPIAPTLAPLAVVDEQGRPSHAIPTELVTTPHDAAAYVRGAIMAVGSLSDPRRSPHLEIRVPSAALAAVVRRLVVRCGGAGAQAGAHGQDWRVWSKSGAAIGALLARVGAHAAFLQWDAARLRRELREEANRATNADRANLGRAAGAAARQVAAIERVVAAMGWDALDDDLRATALARLANPEASLGELGALHDPAVGKATVHRRLARLAQLAAAHEE
jgi:cell division protein WhiA